MKRRKRAKRFAICIDNSDYPASLQQWKVYVQFPDPVAAAQGQIWIMDEFRDCYLFPAACFRELDLPRGMVGQYWRTAPTDVWWPRPTASSLAPDAPEENWLQPG